MQHPVGLPARQGLNQYASNVELPTASPLQRAQDLKVSYDAALNSKHPSNMNRHHSRDQLQGMSSNIRDKYMQMAGA